MIELIIFFSLLILIILSGGFFLGKLILGSQINTLKIYELGFLGIFFYSLLSTSLHFFFPLNETVNLIVALSLIIYCFIFFISKSEQLINYKNIFFIIISFLIVLIMTLNYKPHEDYGFYHLPYIINLVNEKIIFGLANLQAQFAWNSSWLNFSSLLYLPIMKLKGTQLSNSILFFFILLFFLKENFSSKNKNQLSYYFILFLSFYFIIKFSRISGHGFDLPANFFLILAFYYFIKIFESEEIKYLEKNFNLLIIFSTLSITIKLSTFVSPILVIIGVFEIIKRKVKLKNIFPSIFICFIFSFIWLMQQFIYSSCFIPFFEFTCIETIWSHDGLSHALNQVTGALNKSFNQYSGLLTKEEYSSNLNWVSTWFTRNKIEFSEHLAAFIVPALMLFLINYKKVNIFDLKNNIFENKKIYSYFVTVLVALLGLLVWFLKSPVIRFGIPYLFIIFLFIVFFIFKIFYKEKKLYGISIVLILCIFFNLTKNLMRIKNSEVKFEYFPKILKINYSKKKLNGIIINYPDPEIISSQSRLCWSIPFICHIGKGKDIEINKKHNYFIIVQKNE